ncbi:MAG: hypothetical protein KAT16_02025 [Candidatus Heimdallarchaeota archaeon]|nr:hypothetical protein [Candidatus Heimdallarchaeota archaeon]
MSTDYTSWIGQEIKKMIDLLTSRAYKSNPSAIEAQISEIQRGIEYGMNNPESIDPLVLKMARSFVDSIQIYLRQVRRPNTGIPPGGQATVLTGPTMEEPDDSQFSVDELKGALASRKKKKVESKMKGSMDLLKDYD